MGGNKADWLETQVRECGIPDCLSCGALASGLASPSFCFLHRMVVTTGMPPPRGLLGKKGCYTYNDHLCMGRWVKVLVPILMMAERTSSQTVLISTHTLWCPLHTHTHHKKKGRKNFKTCIYPLFQMLPQGSNVRGRQ